MNHVNDDGDEVTIILPTLNEAANIASMIQSLSSLYPRASIAIMDDNSTDGTAEIARKQNDHSGRVKVFVRDPSDRGLTASIIDGIMKAETEYFVVLDADFQHPPESAVRVIRSLKEGNDLAIGVREDKMSMLFFRKFASCGAHYLASTYLAAKRRPRSRDTMSGFFGGRTELIQSIITKNSGKFERRGFKALFDILKFAPRDIKIDEVEFTFSSRRGGDSKLNSRIVLSILRQCGVPGKIASSLATFFLMTPWGRLSAAILLGLFSTFIVISMTGGDAWTRLFTMYTFLSLLLAIGCMVVASEFVMKMNHDSIVRGLALVLIAFGAYALNLLIFYTLTESLPVVHVIASLLGFTIAFSYDAIGVQMRRPCY